MQSPISVNIFLLRRNYTPTSFLPVVAVCGRSGGSCRSKETGYWRGDAKCERKSCDVPMRSPSIFGGGLLPEQQEQILAVSVVLHRRSPGFELNRRGTVKLDSGVIGFTTMLRSQDLLEAVTMEDVAFQDLARAVGPDEHLPDDEGLCKTLGEWLNHKRFAEPIRGRRPRPPAGAGCSIQDFFPRSRHHNRTG